MILVGGVQLADGIGQAGVVTIPNFAMRYVSRYLGHDAIRIAILVYRVSQCLDLQFAYDGIINPRNIISNIIMIFNINSTRGQTRFLTCVARVTCLVRNKRSTKLGAVFY